MSAASTPGAPIPAPATPAVSEMSGGGGDPVPTTPAPSGGAGNGSKPDTTKKPPKRVKVDPVTALDKGLDLEKQILTKKGECGNLCLQIRTLEFGGGLAQELAKFGELFESLGNELVHTSMQGFRLSCFVCILHGILPRPPLATTNF